MAYIFDIRARVNSDDIAMLNTEIVSDHTVHTCTPIIKLIISENNENSILALLSLDENSITTEQL